MNSPLDQLTPYLHHQQNCTGNPCICGLEQAFQAARQNLGGVSPQDREQQRGGAALEVAARALVEAAIPGHETATVPANALSALREALPL